MRKKFAFNLVLLVFLNLLIKPFWIFGIDRTVQNMVGVSEYGFYFSLLNFSLLLNMLLDMGVSNFNNRKVAHNPHILPELFPNAVAIKFTFSILYAIITVVLAFSMGYGTRHLHLLCFLILNQFLISITLYLRTNISGMQMFSTDSLLSVVDRLLMIVLCSSVLWLPALHSYFTIELFVYLQTTAYLMAAVIAFVVVARNSSGLQFMPNLKLMRSVLRQSFPFALLVFLMSMYTRVDAVLLERLLPEGKIQAGIYAQAYRILDAANMFAFLFPSLLLPMFSRLIAEKKSTTPLVSMSMGVLAVFAVAFSFSCIAFSGSIMQMLYHHANDESAEVFQWLLLSFVPMSVTIIFGTLLTARGNLKTLNWVSGMAVVLNLGLNFILIPLKGALGAALSCFVTQTFVALANLAVYQRVFETSVNRMLLLKYALFLMLSAISTWLVPKLPVWFIISFMINAFFVLLASLFSGILPLSKLLEFAKQHVNPYRSADCS